MHGSEHDVLLEGLKTQTAMTWEHVIKFQSL